MTGKEGIGVSFAACFEPLLFFGACGVAVAREGAASDYCCFRAASASEEGVNRIGISLGATNPGVLASVLPGKKKPKK